jgi:hypothetical protein
VSISFVLSARLLRVCPAISTESFRDSVDALLEGGQMVSEPCEFLPRVIQLS